jgi:hypothetical protein
MRPKEKTERTGRKKFLFRLRTRAYQQTKAKANPVPMKALLVDFRIIVSPGVGAVAAHEAGAYIGPIARHRVLGS